MAITNPKIWAEVEQAVLDYFAAKIGDNTGVQAFCGEIPAGAYNCWMFEINGGPEPLDAMFVSDNPGNCGRWRMSAMVQALFTERADAQYVAGVVRTLVPAEEDFLKNVKWLRPVGEPTIERVVVDTRGKEINCWRVEYPLEIIMKEDGVS